jgi:Pvc16 N-terminal domain
MTIAGVGKTLIHLLRDGYQALHGGLEGLSFELFTTTSFEATPSNKVSLFLYRIEVDPTRRHKDSPPRTLGAPPRTALSLDLRYLLTVWVGDAEREHQVLQDCIEIFEKNAIVSGPMLDTSYPWEPDDALRLCIDALTHEDMMRLWDLLEPTYRLSIPYVVRSVKLSSVDQTAAPPVWSRTHIVVPGVD